jgi:hypothetical protein
VHGSARPEVILSTIEYWTAGEFRRCNSVTFPTDRLHWLIVWMHGANYSDSVLWVRICNILFNPRTSYVRLNTERSAQNCPAQSELFITDHFSMKWSDHFSIKWSAIAVIDCVCVSVCPNRELLSDRSTDEHPVWSKRCSIHPDIRHKKPHSKIQPSPPLILGVKWGAGMENAVKNALMFDYLGRYNRYWCSVFTSV